MHSYTRITFSHGLSFGSALAMAISFNEHRSVFWAIIDGILSWLYVIYFVLTRTS